jgi:CRISPR-associated protein Csy1
MILGILREYIEKQAKKKKKTSAEWFAGMLDSLSECRFTTHVGKFTDPDSKIYFYCDKDDNCSGYVITGNVDVELDFAVSANFITPALFLLQILEDGETLLKHIQEKDENIKAEFAELGINTLAPLYQAVERINKVEGLQKSESHLRQVYFPVGDGYHLLTVFPASGLLLTARRRVDRINGYSRLCHDSKSNEYGKSCSCIFDMASINFGSGKPQNISAGIQSYYGEAYLLESLPPVLGNKGVHLTRYNFLEENVSYKDYVATFQRLHKLFKQDRKNQQIQEVIKNGIKDVIDVIMVSCHQIREQEAGWSDDECCRNLPVFQKIWLDEAYRDKRESESWREEVGRYFARWFVYKYKKIIKGERVSFGEEEFRYLKWEMIKVLEEEVRYNL